jgi:hypothetical protein
MPLSNPFAGNIRHQIDQLIDGNHFFRPDIDEPGKVRMQQPYCAFNVLVDIEERARLFAIAYTSISSPLRAIATLRRIAAGAFSRPPVVARDMRLQRMIPVISEVQSFAEQLFPTVFAIGRHRVGRILRAVRIQRVILVVGRIHAG